MTAQSETGAIALGQIGGDLRVRPWHGDASGAWRARFVTDDGGERDLIPGGLPADGMGDADLYISGPLDLTIAGVSGDLIVMRFDGAMLAIGEVSGDMLLDNVRGTARVGRVAGDANVRDSGTIVCDDVSGDLRAQSVADLTAGQVSGDAAILGANRCVLRRVSGDLVASNVSQHFSASEVSGDARLRQMSGLAEVLSVAGDLAAQHLTGGISAVVAGEAYIETALAPTVSYTVTADSIVLRVRGPISAQFVAQSEGGVIHTHLPLAVERHRQNLVGVIGKGEAMVTLNSRGGDIILDAAGATVDDDPENLHPHHGGRRPFKVHVEHGPEGARVNIDGLDDFLARVPFGGAFGMSNNNPEMQDLEAQLKELSDRTTRAARKAAEKAKELSARAAARTREADWETYARHLRTAFEQVSTELSSAFREIVAEFQSPPTTGAPPSGGAAKSAAQRITIDQDETASPSSAATAPQQPAASSATSDAERAARRRAILEQLRAGDLTLEEAEERLKDA